MTGQLDLWAGRQVAPGHRVDVRPTELLFSGRHWRVRCSCGWSVGPYRDTAECVRRALRHGALAARVQAGGPIGG